jgi:hypothetical protein
MRTIETICAAEALDPKWSIQDQLNFHRFNPKGLYHRWLANNDRVAGAIKDRCLKYPEYLLLRDVGDIEAQDLMNAKRPTRQGLARYLRGFQAACERQEALLNELFPESPQEVP